MRRLRGPSLLLVLFGTLGSTARAQQVSVDRAESLVSSGNYAEARAVLDQWWKDAHGGLHAEPAVRARALLLRARLTPDLHSAEKDYLAVILGYPTMPEAAQALLYLGQGLLTAGQISRAVAYLNRLVSDYPGNTYRTTGLLWLSRAERAAGDMGRACEAAREGLRIASEESELAALLEAEESAACRAAVAAATPRADFVARPAERPSGRFTVQSGAFRERRGADALAARLRAAGQQPRLVYVPGSSLLRVRIGRFTDAAAAAALARTLRAAGFAAIVVGDAESERPGR